MSGDSTGTLCTGLRAAPLDIRLLRDLSSERWGAFGWFGGLEVTQSRGAPYQKALDEVVWSFGGSELAARL